MSESHTGRAAALGRLPKISILGYGAGDAANNLAFTTATMFLLIYYTDAAGIPAAAAGTVFLVLRIVDAFADLAVGRLVDRVNTRRFGKFRPFIMFGSIPLLLLLVATFHVPQIGVPGMLIYAYITYGLLNFLYSIVNIPYGSLAAAMTQNPGERAKLATARTIGAAVTGAGLGIFISPLLGVHADIQGIFTTVTISFVFIGIALYMFTAFSTKERVYRKVPHVTMRQSFATLKGNKPLLLLCISSVLFLTGMISMQTAQIYFMRDVFHALYLVPYLSMANLVVVFGMAPFVPWIVRRFGKRNAYIYSAVLGVAGLAVAVLAPNAAVAFAALLIAMIGVMLVNMLVWAIEADTVEYGEWKTGVRAEGITYALFSFTRKTGQAVGGAVAAYAIGVGGYVAGADTQTVAADWGIRAGAAALPALFLLLASAVMLFYPLTDKVHAGIVADIAARDEADEHDGGEEGGEGQAEASLVAAAATDGEDTELTRPAAQDASLSTAALRTGTTRPGFLRRRR